MRNPYLKIPCKSDEESVRKDMVGVIVVTVVHRVNSVKKMDVIIQVVHVRIIMTFLSRFHVTVRMKREIVTLKFAVYLVEDSSS